MEPINRKIINRKRIPNEKPEEIEAFIARRREGIKVAEKIVGLLDHPGWEELMVILQMDLEVMARKRRNSINLTDYQIRALLIKEDCIIDFMGQPAMAEAKIEDYSTEISNAKEQLERLKKGRTISV